MTNRKARRAAAKSGGSAGRAVGGATERAMRLHQLFTRAVERVAAGAAPEAADLFGKVLALDPHHAESLNHLGVLAYRAGQTNRAESFFVRATDAAPTFADAHYNLGLSLSSLGRFDAALAAFLRATTLKPNLAAAFVAVGGIRHRQGRLEDAGAAFARAVAIDSSYAEAHMNLGNVLREQNRLTEALRSGRLAADLAPGSALSWRNLALSLQEQGLIAEALAAFDQALRLAPDFVEAQSGRLFCLNYSAASATKIAEEHRLWGRRFAERAPAHDPASHALASHALASHSGARDPDRRLRVGYVSGDFHTHPISYFLQSVLEGHSRDAVETVCYSTGRRSDDRTDALRRSVDHWRTIADASDADAAGLVRSDAIDILVDLSGHTAGNRLGLFLRRPAPVQVSWLGYVATTGLPTMDYLITDPHTAPPGADPLYTERLARLAGGRFCYAPPADAPLPALSSGRPPAFGSFNNIMKLNAEVVAVWARLLQQNEDAILRLKWMALADAGVASRIRGLFEANGVDRSRILISGHSPHSAMLADYRDVDVALDPFPFGGGLTTCEALWMGVPVVTLPGEAAASRQTAAFLRQLGLDDLVAGSADSYVAIASDLLRDRPRLRQMRASLRERMSGSALTTGALFAPALERGFREMWRRWCAGAPPSSFQLS